MKEIALIIPCFNENKRLKIKELSSFIITYESLIDFYFVDDGSTDLTSVTIKSLLNKSEPNNIFLTTLVKNIGKGNAIREGIFLARKKGYKFYGFIDGDLEIPLDQILKLYLSLLNTNKNIAISVRSLKQKFNLTKPRTIISIIMVSIANKILKFEIPINDSQCGCKLFKNEVVDICFDERFHSQWLFDLEIFLRLRNKIKDARSEIQQVPLTNLNIVSNSTLKWSRNFKILEQLWQINFVYNKY